MPHVPHILIDKHLENGHGDIVMNTILDPRAMEVIHNLGLNGIDHIIERAGRREQSLTLAFDHTEPARLDRDVHLLVDALQSAGLDIDIVGEPVAPIDKTGKIEYVNSNDLKTKKERNMAAAEIPHELGAFALSNEKVPGGPVLTPEQRSKLLAARQGLAEFREAWDATSRQYERTADAFYPPEVPKQIGHLSMINGGQVEAPPAERRAA